MSHGFVKVFRDFLVKVYAHEHVDQFRGFGDGDVVQASLGNDAFCQLAVALAGDVRGVVIFLIGKYSSFFVHRGPLFLLRRYSVDLCSDLKVGPDAAYRAAQGGQLVLYFLDSKPVAADGDVKRLRVEVQVGHDGPK